MNNKQPVKHISFDISPADLLNNISVNRPIERVVANKRTRNNFVVEEEGGEEDEEVINKRIRNDFQSSVTSTLVTEKPVTIVPTENVRPEVNVAALPRPDSSKFVELNGIATTVSSPPLPMFSGPTSSMVETSSAMTSAIPGVAATDVLEHRRSTAVRTETGTRYDRLATMTGNADRNERLVEMGGGGGDVPVESSSIGSGSFFPSSSGRPGGVEDIDNLPSYTNRNSDVPAWNLSGGEMEGGDGMTDVDQNNKSSYNFKNLDDNEFQKTYELLVISNFLKLYPEMITDLNISRTALAQYDDETRQKKFSLCKLYVLIQIENSSMTSLTGLVGLLLRVIIHFLFPSGISKTVDLSITRILENTEKKASALFYFHAISNLKKRNYEAPSIFYAYITELLRVASTLLAEYMISSTAAVSTGGNTITNSIFGK